MTDAKPKTGPDAVRYRAEGWYLTGRAPDGAVQVDTRLTVRQRQVFDGAEPVEELEVRMVLEPGLRLSVAGTRLRGTYGRTELIALLAQRIYAHVRTAGIDLDGFAGLDWSLELVGRHTGRTNALLLSAPDDLGEVLLETFTPPAAGPVAQHPANALGFQEE